MTNDQPNYSERLREAMEERGFTAANKGQSRLADLVRCKPQQINQVLSGASNELSAGPHSRVCAVLGIEARWLADGSGPKYRPPNAKVLEVREPQPLYLLAEDVKEIHMGVSESERALLLKLRLLPQPAADSIRTIVNTMAKGLL